MKPTVFRFGLYASLTILVLGLGTTFLLSKTAGYQAQEIAGYLTIALSMVFIFFGLKYYRDRVNNGKLSFGEGLKLGLMIALLPALVFGLFNLLYVEVIDPGWRDEYYNYYTSNITASSETERQAKIAKLQKQREMFSSPVIVFAVMFFTVFIIGAIVTIISALTLRKK